jgi:hypothetical protein
MKKLKLKLSYSQAEALQQMLQFYSSTKKLNLRHNFERLCLATIEIFKVYVIKKTIFHYNGERKYSLTVAEGYAVLEALSIVEELDEYQEATRNLILLELVKQLPDIGRSLLKAEYNG